MNKTLKLLILMGMSPALLADFTGSVVDLNSIYNPPDQVGSLICNQFSGELHGYEACSKGADASRWMAEKYAKAAGEYMGCVDGFQEGIYDGYLMGKGLAEQNGDFDGVDPTSAVQRAKYLADDQAVTATADQIITKYRRVIGLTDSAGNQVQPDLSYDYPAVTFNGFENGYEYDIENGNINDINFGPVYENGWVNSNTSFEDRLAANAIYRSAAEYNSKVCNNDVALFNGHIVQLTIWDYFKAKQAYDFSNYGWNNASWALDIFFNVEDNLSGYLNYQGLKNKTKKVMVEEVVTPAVTEQQEIEQLKKDAQGNNIPVIGADGQPTGEFEMETVTITVVVQEAVTQMVEKEVAISASELARLQDLYKEGFEVSYRTYYAKQYASINFHKEGKKSYEAAKIIGKLIGKDVQEKINKKDAYDSRYKTVSKSKYAEVFFLNYEESFDYYANIFRNNPVVDLQDATVEGADSVDSIFRPGEGLKVYFTATNLGEKSGEVKMSLDSTNDIVSSNKSYSFFPPSLTKEKYSTPVLANISNNLLARENVNIGFRIDNPNDLDPISHVLTINKNKSIMTRDFAEVDSISTELSLLGGSLQLSASIENPSEIETPFLPKVSVKLNGVSSSVDIEMMKIAAKSKKTASLDLNLDPMDLIKNGQVSGTVSTSTGTRTLHEKSFSAELGGDKASNYVEYFHGLVNGETSQTGNESKAKRIERLVKIFDGMLDQNLKMDPRPNSIFVNHVRWNKEKYVNQTIVAKLQKAYQNSKASGNLTEQGQAAYDRVASSFAKKIAIKGKDRVRFKKAYLKELRKMSPDLSIKKKDHK